MLFHAVDIIGPKRGGQRSGDRSSINFVIKSQLIIVYVLGSLRSETLLRETGDRGRY